MYTSYEYVIVQKVIIFELNKFGSTWRTQKLFFKLVNQKKVFCLPVANEHDISAFENGDKLKLNLDFYISGRGEYPTPRYRINGVIKYEA